MKIGLITFHYGDNYGGILQALATQRVLEGLGHAVEIIDYVPPGWGRNRFWRRWGFRSSGITLDNIAKRLIMFRYDQRCRRAFAAFRNRYLHRSPRVTLATACRDMFQGYDILIAGSDQIWHFNQPDVYFLDTGAGFAGRKISLASCCAYRAQPDERRPRIRELLADFDRISVRNGFSADLIEELTGKRPDIVADPTLLTDMTPYHTPVALPWHDYILLYCLGSEIDGSHAAVIAEIRRRCGALPVIALVAASQTPVVHRGLDRILYTADPGEWLALLSKAAFVYTDSFHGVLFSLKYGRPFLAYYRDRERAPRMQDLSARYALENRVFPSFAAAKAQTGWEFPPNEAVTEKWKAHCETSLNWIREALDGMFPKPAGMTKTIDSNRLPAL